MTWRSFSARERLLDRGENLGAGIVLEDARRGEPLRRRSAEKSPSAATARSSVRRSRLLIVTGSS